MGQNQSPLPAEVQTAEVQSPTEDKKEELLDFPAAMQKIKNGKKISKKEWGNVNTYGQLKDARLILHKENGWVPSEGDIAGKDWFVID